ncbi:MAG: class I SAM-dependent methyltransferase [Planctomycetota bacterium]
MTTSGSSNCPVCHAAEVRVCWRGLGDRLFRTTEKRFDVARCAACGSRFLANIPPLGELAAYYPSDYWIGPSDQTSHKQAQGGLLEAYRRFVLRDHVRFVGGALAAQRARGQSIRMVDVGCGDGSLLEAVGEKSSMGMDLSLAALRATRARGFAAVRGTLSECPLTEGSFSMVTAFHFLEHVHPIEPILASMRKLLAPGGEIIVQVPNARSWQAKLLGRRWAGYDVPRHLINYTDRTLPEVLSRNGFEVLALNQQCVRDNPTALSNSLVPGLYPPARLCRGGKPTGLGAAAANLGYLGVTIASMPFAWLEAACGRGASVMVHARPMR